MITFLAIMFSIIACYAIIVGSVDLTLMLFDDIKKWRNEK